MNLDLMEGVDSRIESCAEHGARLSTAHAFALRTATVLSYTFGVLRTKFSPEWFW